MKTKNYYSNNLATLPVAMVMLSMVCLVSCEAKSPETSGITPSFTNTLVSNVHENEDPTDSEITNSIEVELIIQDGVYSNDIDVGTKEGIVTLSGTLDNILAKERAIEISKAVKGVRSVIDKMEIEKTGIADDILRINVTNALLWDPATDSYEIRVNVNDGHVELSGKVDSWQEKKLSATVAKGVIGVRSLQNNIFFDFKENRPDTEMKNDIVQTLRWDVRVDDGLIDVAIKNGKVTLTGTVGSAAEHSQAEIDAWVAGVKEVNTDGLNVERWARDEDLRTNKYVNKPDNEIRQAVNDAFLYDPRVFAFNPEVSVNNGKVTLSGVVDNLKAKKAAEMDAKNVVGVWRVVNLLKVRGVDFPTDDTIEKNVNTALSWNPYIESFKIGVMAINGTVYLSGTVDTYFDKYEAEDVTSATKGVIDVENNLMVSQASVPFVFDYEYGYYHPYGHSYGRGYTPVKSDLAIRSDIEDQIYWSPNVDLSDVDIKVNNGIANLNGTVDSWNEYYHAEKNAFEGGALSVENDLRVNFFDDTN